MKGETEERIYLAVFFTCILMLGVCGVVVLLGGLFKAFDTGGTVEGAYAIGTALFGVLMCGAAAVLFAMLWPDVSNRNQ